MRTTPTRHNNICHFVFWFGKNEDKNETQYNTSNTCKMQPDEIAMPQAMKMMP
jgi:hypothetical protein